MSLQRLLCPYSTTDFLRDVWERHELHVSRRDPGYFASLRESIRVHDIVWASCSNWGDVSLARAQTAFDGARAQHPPTVLSVRDAFREGYTVVINDLQRKNIHVAQLCRDVEKDLLFNANVNLYMTAASQQGLAYHYDDEDAFILQLEGSKTWRIYDKRASLPSPEHSYQSVNCDDSPYTEYMLSPGDVLYFPRGVVHEARAQGGTSIHLTLSVSVVRWSSFFQQLIQTLATEDVELRKALPLAFLHTGAPGLAVAAADAVKRGLADPVALNAVVGQTQARLLADKARLPSAGRIEPPQAISLATRVAVVPDQVYALHETDGAVVLRCIGAAIEVSSDLRRAIEFICTRREFSVGELPDDLLTEQKVGLVQRLVDCDFLTPLALVEPSLDASGTVSEVVHQRSSRP